VDRAIEQVRALMRLVVEGQVIKEEIRLLERELRVTSQRVNLFEKVKIPESQDNIRKITIYIGDQQANAVGVSKVAKRKLSEYEMVAVTL
ncbi:MAG TPA: V-type ATP synthase subunit D, partial [Candidatus Bathyarchaeia archaeon]|nr:V-type ATP synthase subunit D [Candidatus Bathyarchaeia archaeon]